MKYVASIKANYSHFCSGTFIINSYVLTAAQCIQKIYDFRRPDYSQFKVLISKTVYEILDTKMNEKFDPTASSINTYNDFGLIKVGLSI